MPVQAAGFLLISTHAPRTGSDARQRRPCSFLPHFNPRSPHGERLKHLRHERGLTQFQPTLPARGATATNHGSCFPSSTFQPTLPARGATGSNVAGATPRKISTHAPRTGSDIIPYSRQYAKGHFNPRSPHGERPLMSTPPSASAMHFNPRSPHGERLYVLTLTLPITHFNPRSPHGERRITFRAVSVHMAFQPTLPARGATNAFTIAVYSAGHFNPRSPHGERRLKQHIVRVECEFQPTLPARGATVSAIVADPLKFHFNPRSPHGERLL